VFGALHLNIGNTLIQQNKWEEALEELQLALAYFDQARVRDLLPELYGLFAELYWRLNDLEQAKQYGLQGLELAREFKMPREEGHNLRIMGEIALAEQQMDAAHASFEQSYQILMEAGDEYERAKTQVSLAVFYAAQGMGGEARNMLSECETVFQRLEAQLDLQQVRALKSELTMW
jgi:tetratricopeptide (TPR) repeat protein